MPAGWRAWLPWPHLQAKDVRLGNPSTMAATGDEAQLASVGQQDQLIDSELEHWEDQRDLARQSAEEAAMAADSDDDGVPAAEALFRQHDDALNALTRRQAELTDRKSVV